ncbi:hypothetical protein EVAR_5137_1 [Eumeta japonica]|uniref:Uncharacterized protein n=1 Tax=Eumeta variegata TaxID=151549 RepID=A0A4C1SV78_EUMVA|nr:hypothetical protein EVAR_5137_1 [Eumeta japonica]
MESLGLRNVPFVWSEERPVCATPRHSPRSLTVDLTIYIITSVVRRTQYDFTVRFEYRLDLNSILVLLSTLIPYFLGPDQERASDAEPDLALNFGPNSFPNPYHSLYKTKKVGTSRQKLNGSQTCALAAGQADSVMRFKKLHDVVRFSNVISLKILLLYESQVPEKRPRACVIYAACFEPVSRLLHSGAGDVCYNSTRHTNASALYKLNFTVVVSELEIERRAKPSAEYRSQNEKRNRGRN